MLPMVPASTSVVRQKYMSIMLLNFHVPRMPTMAVTTRPTPKKKTPPKTGSSTIGSSSCGSRRPRSAGQEEDRGEGQGQGQEQGPEQEQLHEQYRRRRQQQQQQQPEQDAPPRLRTSRPARSQRRPCTG